MADCRLPFELLSSIPVICPSCAAAFRWRQAVSIRLLRDLFVDTPGTAPQTPHLGCHPSSPARLPPPNATSTPTVLPCRIASATYLRGQAARRRTGILLRQPGAIDQLAVSPGRHSGSLRYASTTNTGACGPYGAILLRLDSRLRLSEVRPQRFVNRAVRKLLQRRPAQSPCSWPDDLRALPGINRILQRRIDEHAHQAAARIIPLRSCTTNFASASRRDKAWILS